MDFSETITAFDPKIGKCRKLIEFMRVCEYQRSISFFDLGPRSLTYEHYNLLLLRNH